MDALANAYTVILPSHIEADLLSLTGQSHIDAPFHFVCDLSVSADIDLHGLLDKPVHLNLSMQNSNFSLSGIITSAQLHYTRQGGLHVISIQILPWTNYLDRGRNYQHYQNQSVLDISKSLLSMAPFAKINWDGITKQYPSFSWLTQINETPSNYFDEHQQ